MPIAWCPTCEKTWPDPPGSPCPVDGTPLEAIGTLTLGFSEGTALLDGTILALSGPEPFREAIAFLQSKGFRSGDRIHVAGAQGRIGNREVIFIENVGHVA